MKRIIMLSALAAAMAVMLALAGSASAIPPTSEELDPVTGDVVLVEDCPGPDGTTFDIRDDFEGHTTATTFYDRNGDPVRIRFFSKYVDRFYNSETGKEYTATTATTIDFVDLETGQVEAHGLIYHLTVPGAGVVLLDAGTLIRTAEGELVFESGQHQIVGSEPDTEKFCEALAGEPEL
jgi:hypothetical protein